MDLLSFVPMYVWIILALAAVAAAFFYFGKGAAGIVGAAVGIALIYLNGEKSAKQRAENRDLKEEIRNEERRDEAAERAEAAAERVRLDHGVNPDSVREHDPFERR